MTTIDDPLRLVNDERAFRQNELDTAYEQRAAARGLRARWRAWRLVKELSRPCRAFSGQFVGHKCQRPPQHPPPHLAIVTTYQDHGADRAKEWIEW